MVKVPAGMAARRGLVDLGRGMVVGGVFGAPAWVVVGAGC